MHYITVKKRNRSLQFYMPDNYSAADVSKYIRFADTNDIHGRATYRRGSLCVVFNDAGHAIEGYSYGACIFAYTEPCADWPNGRLIWNATSYSNYTSQHQWTLQAFVRGDYVEYGYCNLITLPSGGFYGYEQGGYPVMDHAAELISMPWVCSARSLRRELTEWHYHQPISEQERERRAAKRAQHKADIQLWRRYNRNQDEAHSETMLAMAQEGRDVDRLVELMQANMADTLQVVGA